MKAKVIRDQDGQYYDIFTGRKAILLTAEHAVYGNLEGWLDFNNEQEACKFFGLVKADDESVNLLSPERSIDVPQNPFITYVLQSECPLGNIVRTAYWCGDISASDNYFRIDILIKHEGHPELDKWVYTYVDKLTTITNPNTGEPVNEYDFFFAMIQQGMPFLDVLTYGLQQADLDGTINKRLYS